MSDCLARRTVDQMMCGACGLQWDHDDPDPPECWRKPKGAMTVQVGGSHYLKLRIQPAKFATINGWDPSAFSTLKYLTRWEDKDGLKDLQKARHFIDIRTELIADIMPVLPAQIPMNRYLAENELPQSYWPSLLVLEELVQVKPGTRQQTPQGLEPVHLILSTHLKSLIDELIVAAGGSAIAAP